MTANSPADAVNGHVICMPNIQPFTLCSISRPPPPSRYGEPYNPTCVSSGDLGGGLGLPSMHGPVLWSQEMGDQLARWIFRTKQRVTNHFISCLSTIIFWKLCRGIHDATQFRFHTTPHKLATFAVYLVKPWHMKCQYGLAKVHFFSQRQKSVNAAANKTRCKKQINSIFCTISREMFKQR